MKRAESVLLAELRAHIAELRAHIEDERRSALLDAYLKTPTVQSIADESLKILARATDENKPT